MSNELPIERVEDTARWIALARALESERKDVVFHDPFGRNLAGSDVEPLLRLIGKLGGTWPLVARTYLVDRLINQAAADGADAVLNLAAGLDTRPYRLDLPAALTWIERREGGTAKSPEATERQRRSARDAPPGGAVLKARNEDAPRGCRQKIAFASVMLGFDLGRLRPLEFLLQPAVPGTICSMGVLWLPSEGPQIAQGR